MKHNLFLGVMFALISTFFYSAQAAFIKAYAMDVPLSIIIFTQCLVGLILFLPMLFHQRWTKTKSVITTQKIPLHVLRALLSVGIAYCLFASVRYIPFVNAMLLANVAPLIIPFIAAVFLKQEINHKQWVPILIGFVGIALVLQPNSHIFHRAAFLALGASFMAAAAMVTVRKLSLTDSGETVAFYFFLFATLILAMPALKEWAYFPWSIWKILIIAGVLYALSQYFIVYSLRFANPQVVGSLLYMNIIYSVIISALAWHVLPNVGVCCGIILTMVGGILCIRAEHKFYKNLK